MDKPPEVSDALHRVKRGRPVKVVEVRIDPVEQVANQVLALRIWAGQSPDLPVIERVARIANALKERGFDLNITLPHVDAGRYLEAH